MIQPRFWNLSAAVLGVLIGVRAIGWTPPASTGQDGSWWSTPPCGMRTASGLPCPTCGMKSAFRNTLHGDMRSAWSAQPVGMLVGLVFLGVIIALSGSALTGQSLSFQLSERVIFQWSAMVLMIVLAVWVYQLRLAGANFDSFLL